MDWIVPLALATVMVCLALLVLGASFARVSTWISTHKDLLTLLSVLAGGAFAATQYLESKADTRKKETIAYLQHTLSFDDPVGKAQVALTQAVLKDEAKCRLLDAALTYNSSGNAEPLTRFIGDNKLENHILVLTRFYRSVTTCVDSEICDREIACQHFSQDMRELKETHHGFFMDYRDRWGRDLMAEPYALARACGKRTPSLAKPSSCTPPAAAAAASVPMLRK